MLVQFPTAPRILHPQFSTYRSLGYLVSNQGPFNVDVHTTELSFAFSPVASNKQIPSLRRHHCCMAYGRDHAEIDPPTVDDIIPTSDIQPYYAQHSQVFESYQLRAQLHAYRLMRVQERLGLMCLHARETILTIPADDLKEHCR